MPRYRYTAVDLANNPRQSEITAKDEADAQRLLSRQSLSEIRLFEISPPAEPMSSRKKGLLALATLFVLGLIVTLSTNWLLAPPDLPAIYKAWDQAVTDGNVERQFENFSDRYAVQTEKTLETIKRDTAETQLRKQLERSKLVASRKSEIVKVVKRKSNQYWVILDQTTFLGKPGTLSSQTLKTKIMHLWVRDGLTWKITYVRWLKPSDKASPPD